MNVPGGRSNHRVAGERLHYFVDGGDVRVTCDEVDGVEPAKEAAIVAAM
jgi:hypothetical protein